MMIERKAVLRRRMKEAIARQKFLLASLVFSPQRFIEVSSPSTPSRMWPGVKSSRLSQQASFKIKRTMRGRPRARVEQVSIK